MPSYRIIRTKTETHVGEVVVETTDKSQAEFEAGLMPDAYFSWWVPRTEIDNKVEKEGED